MTRRRRISRRQKPRAVDPIAFSRMLRQRKAGAFVIALLVLVALVLLDRYAGVLPVDDDWQRYHGRSFEVVRVIDGDTLDLGVPDGDKATTRVRLWGVDTPELHLGDASKPPEPGAEQARDFVRGRAEGRRVTLELQRHRLRGRYGRLLAYVVLPDGGVLNAELIEMGYSEHDDRWSHDHVQAYDRLEAGAQRSRRGLWSE